MIELEYPCQVALLNRIRIAHVSGSLSTFVEAHCSLNDLSIRAELFPDERYRVYQYIFCEIPDSAKYRIVKEACSPQRCEFLAKLLEEQKKSGRG